MTSLDVIEPRWVTLKLKKGEFFKNRVDYLGQFTRPRCLAIILHTIESICSVQVPSDVTELRSYLGLCNVFRRLIPHFARIAVPLFRKLRKGQARVYTKISDQELDSLESLMEKLISPPVLALPRLQGPYMANTDDCVQRIGCVSVQKQPDGHNNPIGY